MSKKAEYKITVNKSGKVIVETRKGYVFTAYGVDFGVCNRGGEWAVTDIKTGLLVACADTKREAMGKMNAELCKNIVKAHAYSQKYIDMIAAA